MSHFLVLVVLDELPRVDLWEPRVAQALEPFRETEHNPDSKWDWWKLGGRWSGSLLSAGPQLKGELGVLGSQSDPDGCDLCRVGDLTLIAMKQRNVQARRRRLDDYLLKVCQHQHLHYDEVLSRYHVFTKSVVRYRAAWERAGSPGRFRDWIPGNTDAQFAAEVGAGNNYTVSSICDDIFGVGVPEGTTDLDAWVASTQSLRPFAVLRGGEWRERGRMGWFGCVSDEKSETAWADEFATITSTLKPEQWLAAVDCHI